MPSNQISDQQLRDTLREFWAEILTELTIERDAYIDLANDRPPDADGQPIPLRLPKQFIEKAAKASDQIRRDFPNNMPTAKPADPPASSNPEATTARPKLGDLRVVS